MGKNKILRCVGALLLTSILLLFGCKKDHDKTDVANNDDEIEYKNSSRTKVAQLNISFALVESIFYENDSLQLSREQFVKLVKSNELLNEQLNALDTTFKLDKGAKKFIFQNIIADTYLNKKQDNELINKHREAILTFRAWAVNKLLSQKNMSVKDMILMYAEATHYIKRELQNDYALIRDNEAPIVRRIKNTFLKRKKVIRPTRTIMSNSSSNQTAQSSSTVYQVTLITPDGMFTINCPGDKYILDAAEDEGLSLPYSGRVGADGTSAGRIYSGTVDQSDQSFLDDCQIANGFILLDVAYPTSNSVIMTHQEEQLHVNCLNGNVVITGPPPTDPFPPGWEDPGIGGGEGGTGGGNSGGGSGGGSAGGGTGNPNPNPTCGISANMNVILPFVKIGEMINLSATLNNNIFSVIVIEKEFEVFYGGHWLSGSLNSDDLPIDNGNELTLNNIQINVLGKLKYRLKVNFYCNGATSTIYSNEVSTYSHYSAYDFNGKFASDMSSAWSQTKSSSIANPGRNYEYGFAGYFNAGTRQIEVDGNITSVSALCGAASIGQGLPERAVYSYTDPYYGNYFTVGNFHTHPPLTYCSSNVSVAPGPSSIDLSSTTKYPRIVRTYSQTVSGGHNIDLQTTDHLTHGKSITSY